MQNLKDLKRVFRMGGKILISSLLLTSSLLANDDGWLIKGITIEKNGVEKYIKFKDKANIVTIKDDLVGSVWVDKPKYKHTIIGSKITREEINNLNEQLTTPKIIW